MAPVYASAPDGDEAIAEAQRMVSEKVLAAGEAGVFFFVFPPMSAVRRRWLCSRTVVRRSASARRGSKGTSSRARR